MEKPGTVGDFTTARRWMVGLSALGAVNMGLGTMRQLRLIRPLPDPPIGGFDSDKVLMSEAAFAFGVPDAPIAALGLLANIPLALAGGPNRYARAPLLPILIAAKAIVEVSVAGWYLVQMRTRMHAWCAYCLVGASINALLATLALREANAALRERRARIAAAVAAIAISGLSFVCMTLLDARHRRRERAGSDQRTLAYGGEARVCTKKS
jgi:uncharacterized membrane protein